MKKLKFAFCCILMAVYVGAGTAFAEDGESEVIRKNVSKTPDLTSNKAKMNIMPVYVPLVKADGTLVDADGEPLAEGETPLTGKPIVITYTDEIEDTGAADVFGAVSRDDGLTWQRKNLSKTADDVSMAVEGYPGDSRKPVLQVRSNRMLVAWTDKYCQGGSPRYSLKVEDENDPDFGDPLYEDLYGVAGSQKTVDYDMIKDSEDLGLGVVPYSCVWASRGLVLTSNEVGTSLFPAPTESAPGYEVGDIVWYKPERLTSGRRDALQIFMGAAPGAGFGIAWQEDPAGLRPGAGAGPGTGFSGATTNHKTDIWYSIISWGDFLAQEPVEEEVVTTADRDQVSDSDNPVKPQALNRMSMPIRITDNDVCNTTNMDPDPDAEDEGAHLYCANHCAGTVSLTSDQGDPKEVCVTADGRLLDGDTGASRPNLFLQKYTKTKPDGSTEIRAWAILAYEETKGLGTGSPEEGETGQTADDVEPEDLGKDSIYHSFDFMTPDTVSAGNIVNLPQREIIDTVDGTLTVGDPIWIEGETYDVEDVGVVNTGRYATENARRIRFILQGKSPALGPKNRDGTYSRQGTPLLALYKQGMDGKGRPSDIMLRRMDIYDNDNDIVTPGNPYAFKNFVCNEWIFDPNDKKTCLKGALNMSSAEALVVDPNEQETAEDDSGDKVTYDKLVQWTWTQDNLDDESWMAPMTDARAHRGQIRNDNVAMGFSYTPNWAAARNGNDKFDFIVRRSRDGGVSWPTTGEILPDAYDFNDGLVTLETPTEPRNVSMLKNNKESVVEPRIVAVPGTINSATSGEDKQKPTIFFVSYGLEVNWKKGSDYPIDGVKPDPLPTDMYFARTTDWGYRYETVEVENSNTGESEIRWDWMANRKDVAEAEAQLRMTPDGSKFYATYQSESGDTIDETDHFYGSDIWLRKVDYNVVIEPREVPVETTTVVVEPTVVLPVVTREVIVPTVIPVRR